MNPTATPEARVERTLAAPPDRVWPMWIEPERFARWYGPPGASIPTCEFDARVGGRRFVVMEMQGPDGPMRMCFVGEFVEIEPPTRLVYTESLADDDGNVLDPEQTGMPAGAPTATKVIVELTDSGDGSTSIVVRHVGIPADSPGAQGWTMALEKLAALLDG